MEQALSSPNVAGAQLPPAARPGPPISVCMATYNGARFLQEQMSSILAQIGPEDEVVVVDDASTDATPTLLRSFGDPRIRVHPNERNLGHVQSFARALSLARHDLLFMSDQDDVWLPDRVQRMHAALLQPHAWVLSTNMRHMDSQGRPTAFDADRVREVDSTRHVANIVSIFTGRRRYYGCAIALRREILPVVLPMPDFVESHDLWIAMAGNAARANVHLECETLVRRVHGANASIVSRPLHQKLWSRVVFLQSLVVLLYRLAGPRRSSAGDARRPASR